MAKTKRPVVDVSLESSDPAVPKPRLVKLIIKNYRCIGPVPVEIDLNEIVVLVGANNVGKSTILKAYELVMSQGSSKANLNWKIFPIMKLILKIYPRLNYIPLFMIIVPVMNG
ncbi:MAG TPA: AAA family ATPase [Chitinophaga sp.]|uniref:AAA family ATPase n=1 Tax=Chitinophaga sp. TaxID=1869181 RepID=UPI002DBFB674|nr:AAA family ATPase [Chitinophaga sp.]HEU4552460.1 AAA family ATPase [Chitinophaga sp.]